MKTSYRLLFIMLGFSMAVFSCIKEESDTSNDDIQSDDNNHSLVTSNLGSSHNTGKNCMICHRFTVGGSVYNKDFSSTYPGTIVKLTTQANGAGNVVAKVTTDKSGNIYSTDKVNFGSGLYVSVKGGTSTKYMSAAITNGACNSCHGSATSKIWTE